MSMNGVDVGGGLVEAGEGLLACLLCLLVLLLDSTNRGTRRGWVCASSQAGGTNDRVGEV